MSSAARHMNEWSAAPSPNGADMAFVGKGFAQGWRHGHAHIDESVITLMRGLSTSNYQALAKGEEKKIWPVGGDGGKTLYYMSDRRGAENIWNLSLTGGEPRQV